MNKILIIGMVIAVVLGGYWVLSRDETVMPASGSKAEEQPTISNRIYQNAEHGFAFTYKPNYVLEENSAGFSQHPEYVHGLMLTDRGELEELQSATDAREGPPVMQVRVYENPQKLSSSAWVEENERESNLQMMFGGLEEAVVGGANAVTFTTDGLFPLRYYAVAHGGYIYFLSSMYPDPAADILADFQALVSSFTFIPAPGQQ